MSKFCTNCGNELLDEAVICPLCGVNVPGTAKAPDMNIGNGDGAIPVQKENLLEKFEKTVSKNSKILKFICSCGGIFFGILSIIFGTIIKLNRIGSYHSYSSYGGDAYTGIQNAAAQTGNNVFYLNKILSSGLSFILIIAGAAMIFYFALKLVDNSKSEI